MTCREIVEFLMDYYDGALPSDQKCVFEQHISDCSCCKVFLEQYRGVIQMAASTAKGPPPEMPCQVKSAIIAAIQEAASKAK